MRRRPADRWERLVVAGLRVFGRKGFRRTQMSDIARELGVSQGTLYNHVRTKEALFYFVIDRAFADAAGRPAPSFPLPDPPPGALEKRLRERLRLSVALPRLTAAVEGPAPRDVRAEVEAIVRELYDVVERTWPAIAMLERSALERPELANIFYGEMRATLVERLARYLEERMRGGKLRRVSEPRVTARLLLENVAIFALHRHADPAPETIGDEAARHAVVDLLVHALTPWPPSARARSGGRR